MHVVGFGTDPLAWHFDVPSQNPAVTQRSQIQRILRNFVVGFFKCDRQPIRLRRHRNSINQANVDFLILEVGNYQSIIQLNLAIAAFQSIRFVQQLAARSDLRINAKAKRQFLSLSRRRQLSQSDKLFIQVNRRVTAKQADFE